MKCARVTYVFTEDVPLLGGGVLRGTSSHSLLRCFKRRSSATLETSFKSLVSRAYRVGESKYIYIFSWTRTPYVQDSNEL